MKCLPYSFYTLRKKVEKSPPILNAESKSDNSATDHVVTSSSAASARSIPELYEEKAHSLRVFSMKELRAATCDFSRLLRIGEGGFGCVYKGSIKPQDGGSERTVVAVKMLKKDGYQGHKQWLAEVHFLGVVEHPNLVKLIGYCGVDDERGIQRLLVYEYMENRSLDDHLFNNAYPVLPWETRLQIALGSAQGLAYLHEELEVQVIFRDFKTSNVLLDKDFNAKLSDFGLAREGPTAGKTHVSTAVVGTHGYAAPDYIETGRLSTKSDVWSFGVVLYEMLTGRRSLERNRPKPEQKLLEWVRRFPSESKRFVKIMDTRLGNSYSITGARKIAKLADSCLLRNAKERPEMSKVVEHLKRILYSEEDRASDPGDSDKDDPEEVMDPTEPSESAMRRLRHLTRLGEHVGDISRRGLMIMRRARVA